MHVTLPSIGKMILIKSEIEKMGNGPHIYMHLTQIREAKALPKTAVEITHVIWRLTLIALRTDEMSLTLVNFQKVTLAATHV